MNESEMDTETIRGMFGWTRLIGGMAMPSKQRDNQSENNEEETLPECEANNEKEMITINNNLHSNTTDHDDFSESVDLFPLQIGGHHVMVRHPFRQDLIVKTFFSKEVRFYQDAQNNEDLQKVMSKFHGIFHLPPIGDDLTFGMKLPCLMDLKIGRRLYDDDASPEKISRMIKKSACSTSGPVGFRISGMRYVDPSESHFIVEKLKKDVRGIKLDCLLPSLSKFFCDLEDSKRRTLIKGFIERLRQIREVVEHSNSVFYSSSVLLVYDHEDPEKWECRMIDFVHSKRYPPSLTKVKDQNYLEGISNVIQYFKALET